MLSAKGFLMFAYKDFGIKLDNKEEGQTYLKATCPKCSPHMKNKHATTLDVYLDKNAWLCGNCGFTGDLIYGELQIQSQHEPWKYNGRLGKTIDNSMAMAAFATLSDKPKERFAQMHISEATLKYFMVSQTSVFFSQEERELQVLAFPYIKNGIIYNIAYQGKYRKTEKGGANICFNADGIREDNTIIVFDELDVMTLFECGIKNVIGLTGNMKINEVTNKNINVLLDFLTVMEKELEGVKRFTLAFPQTDDYALIQDELVNRLGKGRCWLTKMPKTASSWNALYVQMMNDGIGRQGIQACVDGAVPVPVSGLFELTDISDKFDDLYFNGLKRGASTGFPTLDGFYTVVPGQWTVVTGIPGHGKSNVLDSIMVNLAKYSDWRFGIFSPENQPIERHFANIAEKYARASFDTTKPIHIRPHDLPDIKNWLNDHFSIILPDEDDSWSIDGILQLAKALVYRKGIKGLVIDPWNEIDHSRPNSMTETEYTSHVLTKIRQFARNMKVHVWLVAHPAKLYKDKDGKYPVPTPYDISGSAHYRNKADNALTIWRNVGGLDEAVVDVHVQKIRFKEVGKVGIASLRFDRDRGCYIDDIDQDKRMGALNDGLELATASFREPQERIYPNMRG